MNIVRTLTNSVACLRGIGLALLFSAYGMKPLAALAAICAKIVFTESAVACIRSIVPADSSA